MWGKIEESYQEMRAFTIAAEAARQERLIDLLCIRAWNVRILGFTNWQFNRGAWC